MRTLKRTFRFVWVGVAASLTFTAGNSAQAAQLALADSPIFLTQGVDPNLIMAIDDSGSMDGELLLRGNDGAAWWRTLNASGTCSQASGRSFVGCVSDGDSDLPETGKLNFNNGGTANDTWKKYVYLFPNGYTTPVNRSFRRRYQDSTHDHYAIPPIPAFAWSRGPEHNAAYFDPRITYTPWPNGGSYTFANSDPQAARFDPVYGAATDAIDLTRDIAGTGNADTSAACGNSLPAVGTHSAFRVQRGMTLPEGTCFRREGTGQSWMSVRSGGCQIGVNNGCPVRSGTTDGTVTVTDNTSVGIRYFPATFYLSSATLLPAGYGYTGATTNLGTAPNGSDLIRFEIKYENFSGQAEYNAAIQNFANWFTYYRKRHQALRAGLGSSFNNIGGIRVAGFRINSSGVDVDPISVDVASNRSDLYDDFYYEWTDAGGTPNRDAVANIVRNFRRTGSGAPITQACQKNFGMLFTDGFSNRTGGFDSVGNIDGAAGIPAPFRDGVSNTLADGVMKAYLENLRPDLPTGRLNVPQACITGTPPLSMDCNRNLHMNFYAVTLGTRGISFDPDASPPQDPFASPPTWPTAFFDRHPSAVDDIWHATVNGRGKLLNAKTPREISDKLTEVLRAVQSETASASTASVSSGSIRTNTQVYQARFDTGRWTGELLAYNVATNGTLSNNPVWNAAANIPTHTARQIFTRLSNGTAAAFTWADVIEDDAVRKAELGASDADVQAMINYIRGDSSNEGTGTGQYRPRNSRLGDIVNSSPVYVGRPAFSYGGSFPDPNYSTYRNAQRDRRGVVYVGANDGMLHAFDTTNSGRELFAYIPGAVVKNLRNLASQTYDQSHKYFVDGAPNMGDAYLDGQWRTVVVGGLNRGGQAIYALDVTNPTTFSASNVLWEFSHDDLGYTYSQPAIVRLANGQWAAVFGNGYNSSEDDDFPNDAPGSGVAQLFIVNLEDGSLIKTITTGVGNQATPNGLATPTVVDVNNDSIADYVYAGDLRGNLWKFDLTSNDDDDWDVSYSDDDGDPVPLYVARASSNARQPITSRVDVARGPNGVGMLVLFGTGKFLEVSDRSTTATQTFYGIYDPNTLNESTRSDIDPLDGRSNLIAQTILADNVQVTRTDAQGNIVNGLRVRITSTNAPGPRGWYLDLTSGERVVANPTFRDGKVIFSTTIPSTDLCSSGGSSWVMELDALTGQRLGESPVDINLDGQIDASDIAAWSNGAGTNNTSVSGFQPTVGLVNGVGIVADPERPVEFKYMAGSTGNMQTVRERGNPSATGRQSWRAVR